MTVKIRQLRGEPLLNAPRREPLPRWLELSADDMAAVRKELASSMHTINGPVCCPLADAHYFLRELGVQTEIGEEERRIIAADMGFLRRGLWDDVFARLHYTTQRLGIGERLSADDVKKMGEGLEKYRKERWWDRVAEMHHYMRGLGVGAEIKTEDREGMTGYLETERKEKRSRLVGLMLWHMKGMGLSPEVTDRDRRAAKAYLGWMRDIGNGGGIAETLYINRLLREDRQDGGQSEMPPLKRFGR